MGKNQALSIALILFVIIACVLGGTTYYFKKNADELQIARDSAVKVIPGKDAEIEKLTKENEILKSYLGPEKEMADITAQYNKYMKLVIVEGGAPAPAPAPKADADAEGEEGADGDGDGEDGEDVAADIAATGGVPEVAKPSYQTVIEFLTGKIKDQNALSSEIETLNSQISDLKTQVDDAREKAKAAGVAETEEKYKTTISGLEQQIEGLNARIDSKDGEIKQQLAAKKKTSRELNRQKAENDELKKQNRERAETIENLEKIHRESKLPPAESKMGELVYVDPLGKQGNIDLGRKDNLTRGITFSVYEPNNLTEYGLKGTIEVLNVSDDREAEVLIFNEDESDPIKVGDVIYTPTWAPGFEEHFAIVGFIDIDNDNKSDLDELIRLIESNGGIVDAYQKDDGKMSGKVTSQTSWIVLGRKPDEKSQKAHLTTYTNMTKAADNYNTKTQQLNDLLRKMGYRPQADNSTFSVRPTTTSKGRVSTGSVSGLYSEDGEKSTTRRPPRKTAY